MRIEQAGIPWLSRGWVDPPRPRPRMMTYDWPLRPNLFVRCTLPVELTKADAERITRFVQTLPFGRADNKYSVKLDSDPE